MYPAGTFAVLKKAQSKAGPIPLEARPPLGDQDLRLRRNLPLTGFTIIELLVVTAVMLMLSSITIIYSSSTRGAIALDIEAAKIGQTIARAKLFAIDTFSKTTQPCGYGVSFDYSLKTYSLFGYNDPSGNLCGAIRTTGISRNAVNRTMIETFQLDPALNFDTTQPSAIYDVLFVAPDPKTYVSIGGSGGPGDILGNGSARVYLITRSGGIPKSVSVSTVGQISF